MATGLLDRNALTEKSNIAPSTRSVGNEELSSFQMDKITSKDSPMRQRAETYGKNYATSRGMLNGSIGAGATFGAFVDRAMPLAMQDADRYGAVADQNLAYQNQFRMSDKNFGQQGLLQKDNQAWQTSEREGAQNFTAGENAADRNLQKDLQGNELTWRSGENALDRNLTVSEADKNRQLEQTMQASDQDWRTSENALDRFQQSGLLKQQQDFSREQNALDRNLSMTEIESRERVAVEQSKAELERLGYQLQLDAMKLNQGSQAQLQMLALQQILAIQQDADLNPSSKDAAILNALDAVRSVAETLSKANQTTVNNVPSANQGFDSARASQIMVQEAAKYGFTTPSQADIAYVLKYAQDNNLTEEQMRAFVREEMQRSNVGNVPSGQQSQPATQSPPAPTYQPPVYNTPTNMPANQYAPLNSGSPITDQLTQLASQYGYNATPEEAASVLKYAQENGLDPAEVVMREMRAMGLA